MISLASRPAVAEKPPEKPPETPPVPTKTIKSEQNNNDFLPKKAKAEPPKSPKKPATVTTSAPTPNPTPVAPVTVRPPDTTPATQKSSVPAPERKSPVALVVPTPSAQKSPVAAPERKPPVAAPERKPPKQPMHKPPASMLDSRASPSPALAALPPSVPSQAVAPPRPTASKKIAEIKTKVEVKVEGPGREAPTPAPRSPRRPPPGIGGPRNTKHGLRSPEAQERRKTNWKTKEQQWKPKDSNVHKATPKAKDSRNDKMEHEARHDEEADDAHYNEVKTFLKKWNLDVDNAVDLCRCSYNQRLHVLGTFSPAEGTRNVNVDFHTFVWGVMDSMDRGEAEEEAVAQAETEEEAVAQADTEEATGSLIENLLRQHLDEGEEEAENDGLEDAPATPEGFDEDEMLDGFITQWELDSSSVDLLQELSPTDRQKVIEGFAPRGEVPNINRTFQNFVRSRYLKGTGKGNELKSGSPDRVEAFAFEWDLDEMAIQKLREFPPHVQEDVISNYNAPTDLANPSSRFMAFLKTLQFADSSGSSGSKPQLGTHGALQEFATQWGLNDDAAAYLHGMAPSLAAEVMNKFDPKAGTKDINGCFIAFVKSRQRNYEATDPYHEFITLWALDEQSSEFLRSLPLELGTEVMLQFSPKDKGMTDVNRIFMSFARSRQSNSASYYEATDPYHEFITHWALDEQSSEFLRSLPLELGTEVMLQFSPKDKGMTDVNRIFLSFARSRQSSYAPQSDPLFDFAVRWQLNNASMDMLKECDAMTIEYIMEKFNPPADTVDFNGRFRKFLQMSTVSTESSQATAAPVGAPACKFYASGNCKNGTSCKFRHDDNSASNGGAALPFRVVPCKFFSEKGYCRNGDACTFLHEADTWQNDSGAEHPWKRQRTW